MPKGASSTSGPSGPSGTRTVSSSGSSGSNRIDKEGEKDARKKLEIRRQKEGQQTVKNIAADKGIEGVSNNQTRKIAASLIQMHKAALNAPFMTARYKFQQWLKIKKNKDASYDVKIEMMQTLMSDAVNMMSRTQKLIDEACAVQGKAANDYIAQMKAALKKSKDERKVPYLKDINNKTFTLAELTNN